MNILGIDIGSMNIKTALCEIDDENKIKLLKLSSVKNKNGVKSGTIIDIEKTKMALKKVLEQTRLDFDGEIDNYIVTISGKGVSSYSGTANYPLWEQADVKRRVKVTRGHVVKVVRSAKLNFKNENKKDLHTIEQEFKIDEQPYTYNPVGMTGVNLKGNVLVLQAEKSQLVNLETVLNDCGIEKYDVVYSPIASAEAILDDEDKESGVIVVNMGAETTELVIYHEGVLRTAKVIPFGSDYVTKDLKIMFRIDYNCAEDLKITKGNAFVDDIDPETMINLKQADSNGEDKTVKLQMVGEIIAARMEEIYKKVCIEIYQGGYHKKIQTIMLTGDGFRLKGADKLFEKEMNCKTIKGIIIGVEYPGEREPWSFNTPLGLVKYALNKNLLKMSDEDDDFEEEEAESWWGRIKCIVSDIF